MDLNNKTELKIGISEVKTALGLFTANGDLPFLQFLSSQETNGLLSEILVELKKMNEPKATEEVKAEEPKIEKIDKPKK